MRRYPPEHLSFLTTTNVILPPPPPKHGQFDRYVGYSPPTVRNFLQHCLYINWGTVCPLTCLRFFSAELFVFYLEYAMPRDVLHCWLSDSRNDSHWTGCVIAHEHHPELAL